MPYILSSVKYLSCYDKNTKRLKSLLLMAESVNFFIRFFQKAQWMHSFFGPFIPSYHNVCLSSSSILINNTWVRVQTLLPLFLKHDWSKLLRHDWSSKFIFLIIIVFFIFLFLQCLFRAIPLGNGVERHHYTTAFHQFVRKTLFSSMDSGEGNWVLLLDLTFLVA